MFDIKETLQQSQSYICTNETKALVFLSVEPIITVNSKQPCTQSPSDPWSPVILPKLELLTERKSACHGDDHLTPTGSSDNLRTCAASLQLHQALQAILGVCSHHLQSMWHIALVEDPAEKQPDPHVYKTSHLVSIAATLSRISLVTSCSSSLQQKLLSSLWGHFLAGAEKGTGSGAYSASIRVLQQPDTLLTSLWCRVFLSQCLLQDAIVHIGCRVTRSAQKQDVVGVVVLHFSWKVTSVLVRDNILPGEERQVHDSKDRCSSRNQD
ncbi:hypothetical protein DNTS_024391 [Danionella cerebrum]|uniref:Uncharacterized protein n=1 Tax=Danionella cerebrum TaxID=2873325 RepID=A0A553RKE5_9TELE|nr:hypothetical protein DNTS_024391 [Danionella translucida]